MGAVTLRPTMPSGFVSFMPDHGRMRGLDLRKPGQLSQRPFPAQAANQHERQQRQNQSLHTSPLNCKYRRRNFSLSFNLQSEN
jgi:hypothetical protein